MKNEEQGRKQGRRVEGEMSSSPEGGVGCVGFVNVCVYVCVCACKPLYICEGRGAKIDAVSEIDTTFHLLRQIGSGNRNTWIYALFPTRQTGELMGRWWLRSNPSPRPHNTRCVLDEDSGCAKVKASFHSSLFQVSSSCSAILEYMTALTARRVHRFILV